MSIPPSSKPRQKIKLTRFKFIESGSMFMTAQIGAPPSWSSSPDRAHFPQNRNLNRSAYKRMENDWAKALDEGNEVHFEITLHPPGAKRPDRIIYEYDIVDPKTGDIIDGGASDFLNEAGQIFSKGTSNE